MEFIQKTIAVPNVILLVDATGSVRGNYLQHAIFDKFLEIIKNIEGATSYRIIFWNSNTTGAFSNGIKKIPFVVSPSTIEQCFKMTKTNITSTCLTHPHLVLTELDDWLTSQFSRTVYFLTDGQIGHSNITPLDRTVLHSQFVSNYKALLKKFPDLQFKINTVEGISRDFSATESMADVAGSDIWDLLSRTNLTNTISEFVSYTTNYPNGHVHIRRVQAPAGHIPFRDGYFSELCTDKFLEYIRNDILAHKSDEDYLLRLVQDLTTSVATLTKGIHNGRKMLMLSHLSSYFYDTALDHAMVSYMLEESVSKDQIGSSQLLSDYRDQLKNLYKTADSKLNSNVARSLGLQNHDSVMSLPYNDTVIVSTAENMTESLGNYQNGCVSIENHLIPMIPLKYYLEHHSPLAEQCLRQWVRIIVSKQYGLNATSDDIIYTVMGLTYRVNNDANMLQSIKAEYRNLVRVMLQKKVQQTDDTEWQRIQRGLLPSLATTNSVKFTTTMQNVATLLDMHDMRPMCMWYLLCTMLPEDMRIGQELHCREALSQPYSTNTKELSFYQTASNHTYTCLITLEDTSATGGWCIVSHGQNCHPTAVFSAKGYSELMAYPDRQMCPICYTKLNAEMFVKVEPMQVSVDTQHFIDKPDIFRHAPEPHVKPQPPQPPQPQTQSQPRTTGKLVLMKGPVGSGKTTLSIRIRDQVLARGGYCIIEGVDQYSVRGIQFKDAEKLIRKHLEEALNNASTDKVVVIDTCGEKSSSLVFGVNFNGWKQVVINANYDKKFNLDDYMAWSLRNVLNRPLYAVDSKFYLNPVSASIDVCVDVHQKKCALLFKGAKLMVTKGSKDHIFAQINQQADRYRKLLDNYNSPIDQI
jgi:hypothetical protein